MHECMTYDVEYYAPLGQVHLLSTSTLSDLLSWDNMLSYGHPPPRFLLYNNYLEKIQSPQVKMKCQRYQPSEDGRPSFGLIKQWDLQSLTRSVLASWRWWHQKNPAWKEKIVHLNHNKMRHHLYSKFKIGTSSLCHCIQFAVLRRRTWLTPTNRHEKLKQTANFFQESGIPV